MSRATALPTRAAACALCAAIACPPVLASDLYDSARDAARAAQDLQDKGRWADAQAKIGRAHV